MANNNSPADSKTSVVAIVIIVLVIIAATGLWFINRDDDTAARQENGVTTGAVENGAEAPTNEESYTERGGFNIYPGAEYYHFERYPVAVSELFITSDSIEDVIAYYEQVPLLSGITRDEARRATGGEGTYIETDLWNTLVNEGEEVADRAAVEYSPLLMFAVVPGDNDVVAAIVGRIDAIDDLTEDDTVIGFRIWTGR